MYAGSDGLASWCRQSQGRRLTRGHQQLHVSMHPGGRHLNIDARHSADDFRNLIYYSENVGIEMPTTCQKCQTQSSEQWLPVGPWTFCASCFEQLNRTRKPVQTNAAQASIETSTARDMAQTFLSTFNQHALSVEANTTCRICDSENVGESFIDVLGIKVCALCYEKMLPKSLSLPRQNESDEDPTPAQPNVDVQPVGRRTHLCAACSRRITPRGAYAVGDGLLCPDCYYENGES